MDKQVSDLELVRSVVEENSSIAMKELFRRYYPMVLNLRKQYYLRNFQNEDWYQEALIICHETCFRFNGALGSKFGSFYKMRLKNHFHSLVRKEMALKRKLDRISISLDKVPDEYEDQNYNKMIFVEAFKITGYIGGRQNVNISSNYQTIDWSKFTTNLNELEFKVLLMAIGEVSLEDICHEFHKSKAQVARVQANCKKKLARYLE